MSDLFPRMARKSRLLEASRMPPCPTCDAWRGDPCRSPSGKPRAPHAAREALARGELKNRKDHP